MCLLSWKGQNLSWLSLAFIIDWRVVVTYLEWLDVDLIDSTQPLSHESEEFLVGPLLGAAIHHHVTQLGLVSGLEVELDQLVDRLLKVQAGLDGQVDGTPERDHVGLGLVNDGGARGSSGLVTNTFSLLAPS